MGKTDNIKRAKRLKEAKRQREQDALIAAGLGPAGQIIRERSENQNAKYIHNIGSVKYSELLKEFVSTIIDDTDDIATLKSKFLFGSFVWNAAIMKDVNEDVYNSAKNEVLSLGPNFPDIDVMFETMALRKKMEFAEYTNIIMDVEIKKIRGLDYDLTVATSPLNIR